MQSFSKKRDISKAHSGEEDITGNFFWVFCFNFGESWGSDNIENTHFTQLWLCISQASSMQNQKVGPLFL